MELAQHASVVMTTLDEGINALDNLDYFMDYLHNTGRLHFKIKGFKKEYFWESSGKAVIAFEVLRRLGALNNIIVLWMPSSLVTSRKVFKMQKLSNPRDLGAACNSHDDRGGDRGPNRGRGNNRGGGGGRVGNRGGFGAPIIKRYNRPKFRGSGGSHVSFGRRDGNDRARFQDTDGDIDMQGGGGNLPDHMRNRLQAYFIPLHLYHAGRDVYVPPHVQNRSNEPMWYKVLIPQGKKFGKDFILREIKARMNGPLIPFNFQFDGSNAIFFLNSAASASAVRSLNKTIDTPSGFKMAITIKGSEMPTVSLDDEILPNLKMVMSKRYDPVNSHLNLSSFHAEPALKELNLYIPLNRTSILSVAVKIIVDNIPEVQTLDLSDNKLLTLYPLSPLHSACKQLRSLNLANNKIPKMSELDSMKGMASVQELILEGNPVCSSYNDKTAYISAVRQRFPKVVLLDRNELPPPISFDLGLEETIPLSKGSVYFSTLFLFSRYFTIFDSKDRSGLLDAYHDNAIFSMGACKLPYTKTDVKEFFRENRNLMRLSNIVSRNLIVPALRSFTRTFFVVPQGAGFSIVNETLFITGGTDDQIRTYPVPDNPPPTPAVPAAAAAAAVAPIPAVVPVEQERMILELCAQTRMNRAFSERLEGAFQQRRSSLEPPPINCLPWIFCSC
ncbi:hypothetical protein HPB48_009777 [Haemaphysalis longicornis]|uniref:Nuclear RNA export factor 1 n=1 Tax=Haemaphysalis longicornis TaxID=44386 RepID=A0A9J6GKT7_HAELO|nr:hypothetical protein HPB48_009777 [Haemaphysalis longicornis]